MNQPIPAIPLYAVYVVESGQRITRPASLKTAESWADEFNGRYDCTFEIREV